MVRHEGGERLGYEKFHFYQNITAELINSVLKYLQKEPGFKESKYKDKNFDL